MRKCQSSFCEGSELDNNNNKLLLLVVVVLVLVLLLLLLLLLNSNNNNPVGDQVCFTRNCKNIMNEVKGSNLFLK